MAVGALIQVRLKSSTNLPADDCINTFAFVGDPAGFTAPGALAALANDIYNNVPTGATRPLADFISGAITRAQPSTITAYDLSDPEPRQPIAEEAWTPDDPTVNDPLPLEVAICLSFAAIGVSGQAMRRRRGRVYFGPLTTDALEMNTVGAPAPTTELMSTVLGVGEDLMAMTGDSWGVWSRADDVIRPVVRGWVDNEFDTQRRRGRQATQRLIF